MKANQYSRSSSIQNKLFSNGIILYRGKLFVETIEYHFNKSPFKQSQLICVTRVK